jgi:hypothetical protein
MTQFATLFPFPTDEVAGPSSNFLREHSVTNMQQAIVTNRLVRMIVAIKTG